MKPGIVMGLRRRRGFARWLVALLLLPVVLGVIPVAPLSAEQALARDLALSICSPNGGQNPQKLPATHDQQCVLCTIGCTACASMALGGAGVELVPAVIRHVSRVYFAAAFSDRPQWRLGAPPRGPPVSFGI